MQPQHQSLYDLLINVRRAIALNFDQPIWLTAEIAQRSSANGHAYLTLVEKDKESDRLRAQVDAVIWKTNLRPIRRKILQSIGDVLSVGAEIAILAEVSYHQVYGLKLSIIDIDEQHTLGLLAKQRLETLARLQQEKLLELNHKVEIPEIWQRIAVISSAKAAGYHDFQQSLQHSPFKHQSRLYPAALQGDRVRESIVTQLELIGQQQDAFDVVVIIRGGGSKLDLRGFDDFEVCAAIAKCPVPVITGIGHETDQSLADMVAAFSVKTPTAAAEKIIAHNSSFLDQLLDLRLRIRHWVKLQIDREAHELVRHGDMVHRLTVQHIDQATQSLRQLQEIIRMSLLHRLAHEDQILLRLSERAKLLDPRDTLGRGYTLTEMVDGKRLWSPDQLRPGDEIVTHWLKGRKHSTITN